MPRLSFSLRDVFWLTLVVGMGVGWWVDRSNRAGENLLLRLERNAARDSVTALQALIARDQQDGSRRLAHDPETRSAEPVGQP
jgi:hypothetical protein